MDDYWAILCIIKHNDCMYYTGAAVVPLYRFIFTVSLSNFTSLMSICLICTSLRLSVALMYVAAVSKHTGLHINTSSWKEQRGPKEPGCELFFFTLFFSLPSCYIYIYSIYIYCIYVWANIKSSVHHRCKGLLLNKLWAEERHIEVVGQINSGIQCYNNSYFL